jgi:hypothetical protein
LITTAEGRDVDLRMFLVDRDKLGPEAEPDDRRIQRAGIGGHIPLISTTIRWAASVPYWPPMFGGNVSASVTATFSF